MKISVVVPAYNEEKLISASLRSIRSASAAFEREGWETELIVCDNNSTDRTAELAREAGARVVFEPVNQIARARNRGAEAATGDWLIFVDADSHPSEGLFGEVASQIIRGVCLGGGCTLRVGRQQGPGHWIAKGWNVISRLMRWAAGSFVFCEAGAYRRLGGFDQELFASEELDFSRRLKKLARRTGRKVIILSRHPMVTSDRKLHLYRPGEHVWFLLKVALHPRSALRDRRLCHQWYDGRR